MNKFNNIKTKSLSGSEKSESWQKISLNLPDQDTSSFNSLLINKPMLKPILSVLVILGVVFGGGIWTVQAADQARPGDTLYPVDRAVENVRLAFTRPANKTDLKIQFAEERASEVRSLVAEEEASISKFKEIKVTIYSNYSLVDITIANGKHFGFSLNSVNQEEVVKMIANRLHVSIEAVKRVIDFKVLPQDQDYDNLPTSPRPSLTADGKLKESTTKALDYIAEVRNELEAQDNTEAVAQLDNLIKQVKQDLETIPQDIKPDIEAEDPVEAYDITPELEDNEDDDQATFDARTLE